jgi:hypothetical protein
VPLLANLTVHYGWRVATWAIAAIVALAIPFVALFMRDTPRQLGFRRLGSDRDEIEPAEENPIIAALRTLFEATRSPAFLVIGRKLFRVRRKYQWIDWNSSDSGLRRSWVLGGRALLTVYFSAPASSSSSSSSGRVTIPVFALKSIKPA